MRPTPTLLKTCRWLAAIVALAALTPETAFAERKNPLTGQPAVRRRVELRKHRFEITPQFMVSMNQDFKHFLGGGVVLQFHILDWLGVAAQVAGGGTIDSALTGKINDTLDQGTTAFQPTKQQFQDHLGRINLLFSAYATITPVAGKMMIFGSLPLRYDTYLMLGVGGMNVTNSFDATRDAPTSGPQSPSACENKSDPSTDPNGCDPHNSGIAFGGMFGVGVKLYFTDWFAFNIELRDFLASTNPAGLDVNGDRKVLNDDKTISNNLFVGFGATFMLPIRAKTSP